MPPTKQNASQPGSGNRSQPRYNHGRLNHLEAEAVQETPDMIVGMFPVDSHIAEVLFDTGATHSFITASWVEAHNLPITTMSTPIQIDSAGGRILADSICLNVCVEIRGIAFPANLIVMGMLGRRRRRHPSLDAFASHAAPTKTRRLADLPFAPCVAG
jgi:hypothetical protein